jgi:ABC-type transport system substrate-binding protein
MYDPARPEYATRLESTLEVLGFDVRPVITDFETVVDLAFSNPSEGARGYDMYLLGWTLGNPAYPDYFGRLFAAGGHSNNTGYDSASFSAALADYRAATNHDEARAALNDMEQRLAEDLPYLVLYHPQITEAYRSDRVQFSLLGVLGGIQARIGGLGDVSLIQ